MPAKKKFAARKPAGAKKRSPVKTPKKKVSAPRKAASKAAERQFASRKPAPRASRVKTKSVGKPQVKKKALAGKPVAERPRARRPPAPSFTDALAALLKSRGMKVPAGLEDAPAQAYAGQPASIVDMLAKLPNAELVTHAEKVASYAGRQAARAKAAWENSPLIAEVRRRRLKEPERPARAVGITFSLKKPLSEWSDRELLEAAAEWSRRGRGSGT